MGWPEAADSSRIAEIPFAVLNRPDPSADYWWCRFMGRAGQSIRMKRRSFKFALAAIFAVSMLALAAAAYAENRVALVIGNNAYKNGPKLQKSGKHTRTLSDTLKPLTFNLIQQVAPT